MDYLPPILENLTSEWATDSAIDEYNLEHESIKIGKLHSKYSRYFVFHSLKVRELQNQYNKLRHIKTEYLLGSYNDVKNKPIRDKYNLGEPVRKTLLKADIERHLESDDDLAELLINKTIHEQAVDFCKNVMNQLNSRTYQIGNAIKMILFNKGAL